MMVQSVLHANWWVLALRGFVAVVFGLVTFLVPGLAVLVVVSLFGIYCLLTGGLALVAAWRRGRSQPRWWALVLEGAASLLTGALALWWPGMTWLVLLSLVAAWALVTGLLQIGTAIRLRKQLTGEWALLGSGVLSVLFGILLLLAPLTGTLVLSWWIGAYAFVFGILLAVLAFRLRRSATAHPVPAAAGAPPLRTA